jgi:hypothetical protein
MVYVFTIDNESGDRIYDRKSFETRAAAEEWINQWAADGQSAARESGIYGRSVWAIIEGVELHLEPVKFVTRYQLKRQG